MAKILLVEDDKSLREIYGVRLLAEGYEIVSAGDGEEALAMAIKERPDLIVSDVMMPKISGFDMLDILRSTSETKDVKVIMMTALSSDDQRARGESLGADRYLVKSQVGIEDVVRTVHDVLSDSAVVAAPVIASPAPESTPVFSPEVAPAAAPVISQPQVAPAPATEPQPVVPSAQTFSAEPSPTPAPVIPQPVTPVAPTPDAQSTPAPTFPSTPSGSILSELPANPAPAPVSTPPQAPVFSPEPVAVAPVVSQPQPAAPIEPAPAPTPEAQPTPTPVTLPQPTAPFSSPAPASLGERIIQPLTVPSTQANDIGSQIEQALGNQLPPNPGNQPPAI